MKVGQLSTIAGRGGQLPRRGVAAIVEVKHRDPWRVLAGQAGPQREADPVPLVQLHRGQRFLESAVVVWVCGVGRIIVRGPMRHLLPLAPSLIGIDGGDQLPGEPAT